MNRKRVRGIETRTFLVLRTSRFRVDGVGLAVGLAVLRRWVEGVNPRVSSKVVGPAEGFTAARKLAHKGFFSGMGHQVALQVFETFEGPTAVWIFATVTKTGTRCASSTR